MNYHCLHLFYFLDLILVISKIFLRIYLVPVLIWNSKEMSETERCLKLHWARKITFLFLGSDCWSILGYIGVAKSENVYSLTELARVLR